MQLPQTELQFSYADRYVEVNEFYLFCGSVSLSLLLDTNLSDPDFFDKAMENIDVESQHLNDDEFMSLSFQSNRPIALKKFQQFLDYQLPENVFRAKGILWFEDSPLRHIFQLSGKRFTINDSEWIDPPKNQIVLIGRKLDKLLLIQRLNNCISSNQYLSLNTQRTTSNT